MSRKSHHILRILHWLVIGAATITFFGWGLLGPPVQGWFLLAVIASSIASALYECVYVFTKRQGMLVGVLSGLVGGLVGGPLALFIIGDKEWLLSVAVLGGGLLAGLAGTVVGALLLELSKDFAFRPPGPPPEYIHVGRNIRVRKDFTIEIWRWGLLRGLFKDCECTPRGIGINTYYVKALHTPVGRFGPDAVGMTWPEFCDLVGISRLDNTGADRLRNDPRTKKIGRCYILDREMTDEKSNLIYPFTAFWRIDCTERPSLTLRWGGPISDRILLRVSQKECCTIKALMESGPGED
jgi:hypothetical protein